MISLSKNAALDKDSKIIGNPNVKLGIASYVGPGVKIVGDGDLIIGDYCKIHAGTFINLDNGFVSIGHNCWIGERSVLDGRGTLKMGNNVGVGIGSQLYSHIAHGDTIEGCNLYGNKPLILEDDVWLVGQCFVSPIHAHKKSVAMLGSVVIKDMQENKIYSGNPAIDVTNKLGVPWQEKSANQKYDLLVKRISNFCNAYPDLKNECDEMIIPCMGIPDIISPDKTYIDVTTRTYTKRLTSIEIKFLSWLTSYKGRFLPV